MTDKKIQVTRSSMPPIEEYIEEIRNLWDTRWLTNRGEKHMRLEEQLKEYLKAEEISLFTNGHLALEMCIQAMGLSGEVITTPFTFASTTQAIVRNGLTPVFCDINPVDFTIDTDKLEALITDKTSAIIPVHVYGNICDVEKIEGIAKKHGLKVIYDSAHAFGIEKDGRGIGTFGDANMFSFHATKVFHTIEGGCVTTSEPALIEKMAHIKNFGMLSSEVVDEVGGNAKMNEFQAAMGLCNLKHIDAAIAARKQAADVYRARFENAKGIAISPVQEGVKPNYAYFPIVIDEEVFGASRDDVAAKLAEHNITARKYFYPLTSSFDCYKDKFGGNTPVAEKIAKQVLTLPLYEDLGAEDANMICDIILEGQK